MYLWGKQVRLAFNITCYNVLKHEIMVKAFLAKLNHEKKKLERFSKAAERYKTFFKNEVKCGF